MNNEQLEINKTIEKAMSMRVKVDYSKITDIQVQCVAKRPEEAAYELYLLKEDVKNLSLNIDNLNESLSTIYDSGELSRESIAVVRLALGLPSMEGM